MIDDGPAAMLLCSGENGSLLISLLEQPLHPLQIITVLRGKRDGIALIILAHIPGDELPQADHDGFSIINANGQARATWS